MHAAAILDDGCSVDSGTDERVRELHSSSQLEQTRIDSGVNGSDVDVEQFGCTMEQQRVAEWFRGGHEEEHPSVPRELEDAR